MASTGKNIVAVFAVSVSTFAMPAVCAAAPGDILLPEPVDVRSDQRDGGWSTELMAVSERDFLTTRSTLIVELTQKKGSAAAGILLDLAQLHVSRGMLVEARSFLREADRRNVSAEINSLGRRLSLIVEIIDGERVALDHPDLVENKWGAWPYFNALAAIGSGATMSESDLVDAAAAAANVPDDLLDLSLPILLEVALDEDHWTASRDIAERMLQHATLRDSSALHFLLGRAAELGEENVAAFDSYRRAAEKRDGWAHRARLAIIDLAERNGALDENDRLQLLRAARWLWSGDAFAGETLLRLAQAEASAGSEVNALTVLHDLGKRHQGSLYAQKSAALSEDLLEAFYEAGTRGTIPLSDFISGHARIAADRRLEPQFALRAEAFADFALDAGITSLAVREYNETAAYLAAGEDLGLAEKTGRDRDRLRLKQAEALMRGGQVGQAEEIIEAPMISETDENQARREALRVQLFADMGKHEDLLALETETPSVPFELHKAGALFDAGNWSLAFDAYEELWAVTGDAMPISAAAKMVLAAHRSGRKAHLRKVVQALPALKRSPDWGPVAATLARERPSLFPLRKDTLQDALAMDKDPADSNE
ncbi:hypothetical protein [Roseivivax sp. CAU 1753]